MTHAVMVRAPRAAPRWSVLTPLLLTLALASAAGGQAPPAAHPDFRVLRFDEDWSVLRDAEVMKRSDHLKYLPLGGGGSVYLSLGGQLRYRAERVENFMLASAPNSDDGFSPVRAFLHADMHVGKPLRVFVEGKHATAYGRELPGGRRPIDQDEWELQNVFVELAASGGGTSVAARLGRQELLLGSQRLLSPLDWANTRRTFEGARVFVSTRGLALDGFWTRPVEVEVTGPNRAARGTDFWGLTLRPGRAAPALSWDAYALLLQQDSTGLWGHHGVHERLTVGGRVLGSLFSAATRFEVEGGWQGGELDDRSVSAWFVASEVRRTFSGQPAGPTAAVGLDYASGDANPSDARVGTFHQLFPLGHAYAGYMDLLGRQNLVEARGVLTARPAPRLQTRAALHHFLRARTEDAVYGVGGGILRPATDAPDREIGTELDLSAGYQAGRHLRVDAGYSHFFPGAFMEQSPAGAHGSDWVYASTSLTF